MADWRLWLRISFALNLATGISPAPLVPVLGTLSALLKCKLNEDTLCTEFAPCECTLRLARLMHVIQLVHYLGTGSSECEFYLEHFVVQLYLYMLFVFCVFIH